VVQGAKKRFCKMEKRVCDWCKERDQSQLMFYKRSKGRDVATNQEMSFTKIQWTSETCGESHGWL
jgi:hypothetical protein